MFAATDKEYANIMNKRSGGRIKVDQDEWGVKVLVPTEEDPSLYNTYYVNHPGFSLNDFKKMGADAVLYLGPARVAAIPKGFTGRLLTATGSGFGTESTRDAVSVLAGGEWDPIHVFGGTIGIGFGQLASEGIGKIMQATAGTTLGPKRVSPDVARSVDLKVKQQAGTYTPVRMAAGGRIGPVYKTLPPERQKDTGRLYELTTGVKKRLRDAGIDPAEFNDEAILALNRIVQNNSQAVNILSGRTALSDIPMTNPQKAVQDDVIRYNQYTQQNPVEALQMQQLGRKGTLGNEIVEELHTLESNQVSAVNDLIEAMAGTKFYKENFREALRKKKLAGQKLNVEQIVQLREKLTFPHTPLAEKKKIRKQLKEAERKQKLDWRYPVAMETGDDIMTASGGVSSNVVVKNALLQEKLAEKASFKKLTGKEFLDLLDEYRDTITTATDPFIKQVGRIGKPFEELQGLVDTKSTWARRTFPIGRKKLGQANLDKIESLLEEITSQYKTTAPKTAAEQKDFQHINSLVETAHTESFSNIAKYMAQRNMNYKEKQKLLKVLKRQRTLYFKSANKYTEEIEYNIEDVFKQRKKQAEKWKEQKQIDENQDVNVVAYGQMYEWQQQQRDAIQEVDMLVNELFSAPDYLTKKNVQEINNTLQKHVREQSVDPEEFLKGGPIASTGGHAVYEFRKQVLKKIILPGNIRRIEQGSFAEARRALYDIGMHLNTQLKDKKGLVKAAFAPGKDQDDISGQVVQRLERLAKDLQDINKVNYGEWKQTDKTNFRERVQAAFQRFTVPRQGAATAGKSGPAVISKDNTQWQNVVNEVVKLFHTMGIGATIWTTASFLNYPGYALTAAALTGVGGYALTHSKALPGRVLKNLLAKSSGQAATDRVIHKLPPSFLKLKYADRRGMLPTAMRAGTYAVLPDTAAWTAGTTALEAGWDLGSYLGPYRAVLPGAYIGTKAGVGIYKGTKKRLKKIPSRVLKGTTRAGKAGVKAGVKAGASAAGQGVKKGAQAVVEQLK